MAIRFEDKGGNKPAGKGAGAKTPGAEEPAPNTPDQQRALPSATAHGTEKKSRKPRR